MLQKQIQILVERSCAGDKKAFEKLVAEFQSAVFRISFRLLCDEDEAKDIVQETFIKVWLGIAACSDKYYRIDTQINGNGSGVRVIYAKGDSVFLSGDTSHNPFLFKYASDWHFETMDNTLESILNKDEIYNVGIRKTFRSVNELTDALSFSEELRPLIAPKEQLKKDFRWFYTYYSFEAVYPHLPVPISINQYMNEDEQKCWFQGDFSIFRGQSGFECKEALDDIETSFYKWYIRNMYEVSFNIVRSFAEQAAANPYFSGLEAVKDTVFALNLKSSGKTDFVQIPPKDICSMLDAYYHTASFSSLFSENKDSINHYFDEQIRTMEEGPNQIRIEYHLNLPGKVFLTNSDWNYSDTLIWEINAIRLYASEDYILTAESRKTNVWAFILTFLVGIGMLTFCVRQKK